MAGVMEVAGGGGGGWGDGRWLEVVDVAGVMEVVGGCVHSLTMFDS